jgi:hypothetical protein
LAKGDEAQRARRRTCLLRETLRIEGVVERPQRVDDRGRGGHQVGARQPGVECEVI